MPFHMPFRFPYYYNNYKRPQYLYHNNVPLPPHNPHSPNQNSVPKKEDPEPKKAESSEYFFELFGIKLYYDDILIICILFFLYKEEVKDFELFLSLIMLLIS